MASAAPNSGPGGVGGGGTGPTAAAQRYFCHQCDRTVSITPSDSGDLLCPLCNGGFIEEFDLPPPNPNPNPSPAFSFDPHHDPFFPQFLLSSLSSAFPAASVDVRAPTDLAGLFGAGSQAPSVRSSSSSAPLGPEPFNPLQFIQNYLQTMAVDGANIQFVFEGGGGGSPFAGNFGDYFIGPGLEQLIQQLAENDPNRYGTPPAAKSAIDSLPDVKISQELIQADDGAQCAVCKDEFEIGADAKQIPCKHLYHKDCIMPWLELHNSCPVCRYELPTDDPDYENRRRGVEGQGPVAGEWGSGGVGLAAAAAAAAGAGEGNAWVAGSPRTVERRFRIQLPWPFGAAGSQTEGSNAGSGGSGSGGGQGNGGGASGGHGPETRQEDLD